MICATFGQFAVTPLWFISHVSVAKLYPLGYICLHTRHLRICYTIMQKYYILPHVRSWVKNNWNLLPYFHLFTHFISLSIVVCFYSIIMDSYRTCIICCSNHLVTCASLAFQCCYVYLLWKRHMTCIIVHLIRYSITLLEWVCWEGQWMINTHTFCCTQSPKHVYIYPNCIILYVGLPTSFNVFCPFWGLMSV